MGGLAIEELTTQAQLEGLRSEWDALVQESGTRNPFLTHPWVCAWHQHLSRGPLMLLVARRSGKLVGVVPFERVAYRLPLGLEIPTIQMMGRGQYQFELRGMLCAPGLEPELVDAALSHIRTSKSPWICTVFDGLLKGSDVHQTVISKVEDHSSGLSQSAFPAFVLPLPKTWEEFKGGLKRNIKESLRKCYNSLTRDGLNYSFEVWNQPERLNEALELFLKLHNERAEQDTAIKHRNYFETPQQLRFLRAVAPRLLESGVLHPTFLKINEEVVASRLALELNGELYLYYSGFDGRFGKYSVGTTITAECIKWAIGRGLRSVNLSAGKDVSKTRWGGVEEEHASVVVVAEGLLPKLVFTAYSALGKRDPQKWKRLFGARAS